MIDAKDLEIAELKRAVALYRQFLAGSYAGIADMLPFICGSSGKPDSTGLSDVILVCPALGSDVVVAYERTTKLKDVMLSLKEIQNTLDTRLPLRAPKLPQFELRRDD